MVLKLSETPMDTNVLRSFTKRRNALRKNVF